MNKICEVCLRELDGPILSLGSHPLCDDLIKIGNSATIPSYHQQIVLCSTCLTAHQMHPVEKSILFKPDYHYRARLTKDVLSGMTDLVNVVNNSYLLNIESPTILDIGCNDGSLLGIFKSKRECRTIGVDPTNAILENQGIIDIAIQDYFNNEVAKEIIDHYGHPDVITFTNVFAHIENLQGLIEAILILVGPSTIIVIENHYLGAIIERFQFDTFYHEHPRTYSFRSFEFIAQQLKMNISDVQFPSRYGGNIRIVLSRSSNNSIVEHERINEDNFLEEFMKFQEKFEVWLSEAKNTITDISKYGEIAGKSLPGRAVMLISALGIDSSLMPVLFEQPLSPKIGFYVPGTDIQIISDDEIALRKYTRLILWAWHIPDEVIEYLKVIGFKGQVWAPLPTFSLIAII